MHVDSVWPQGLICEVSLLQGYYDGQVMQLTKRHQQRQRRRKGPDERAIITGQRLPEPGERLLHQGTSPDSLWMGSLPCPEHRVMPLSMGSWDRSSMVCHELSRLCYAGNPSRKDVAREDMVWTIRCDELNTVTAFALPGSAATFGYVTRESDRYSPPALGSLMHSKEMDVTDRRQLHKSSLQGPEVPHT